MTTLGHNNSQAKLDAICKRAEDFGKSANKADAALPSLALDIVSATAQNELTVNMDRTAKQPDDIDTIYGKYLAARVKQKNVVSPAQQVSKLRKLAKVGVHLGDAGATLIENAKQKYEDASKDEESRKLLRKGGLYDFMITVAGAQLALIPDDTPANADKPVLTEDAVNEILFPGERAPKSPGERVRAAYEAMRKLRDGKHDKDGNIVEQGIDNENLSYAIDYLYAAWSELDPEAYEQEVAKEAAKAKKDAGAMELAAMMSKAELKALLRTMH